MIIFDLKCPSGHVFEAWFGSSDEFDDQQARGLVSCPLCGSSQVAKAPMAPAVPAKANSRPAAGASELATADPERIKAMLATAAAVQKTMLENSEAVGDRFADEARAIHLGEAAARSIHGRATREQAESLVEDGIPVAPLPFPVVEPGEEN
ncbi:MAG: hypothetical protein JWO25_496 [Alphaproteobacteria bacterium]|nr:hypothetical protein [Alphaproteobacteria bacterium]MDB5722425.1 hypothetical protein [Alphaproteobacteria bacterium]